MTYNLRLTGDVAPSALAAVAVDAGVLGIDAEAEPRHSQRFFLPPAARVLAAWTDHTLLNLVFTQLVDHIDLS